MTRTRCNSGAQHHLCRASQHILRSRRASSPRAHARRVQHRRMRLRLFFVALLPSFKTSRIGICAALRAWLLRARLLARARRSRAYNNNIASQRT